MKNPANHIRLLVVDDHAIVREGISSLLKDETGIEIVAEASNGREAIELAQSFNPDIILMDINMPEMDGLEAAKQMKERKFPSKVIFLTMEIKRNTISTAVELGVEGYLPKLIQHEDLIDAIKRVHTGEIYFHPDIADKIFKIPAEEKTNEKEEQISGLNFQELETLKLIGKGLGELEISRRLSLSQDVVSRHRMNIMTKLGCTTMIDLIEYAVKRKKG